MITKNRKGQMLVEVAAAVVIGAVALTAIMRSLTLGYGAAVHDQEYTKALLLLENNFQDIVLTTSPKDNHSAEECPAPWERFQYKTDVLKRPAFVDAKIDRVQASIAWGSGKGSKNIAVTTFLTEKGP